MATAASSPQTMKVPFVAPPPPNRGDRGELTALLRRCTLALLAAGLLWRTVRYLLSFPLWGDEAMICLNFLELDYAGLLHELRYCQVAPLLFLWGELTSLRLFGGSELAMRLLPFLAGTGSLLLFWRLARATLPPPAGTLAVGFLAVAIWPVSMCTFAKPYSLDLLMSLVLLLPAAHCLRQPGRVRWLVLLVLVTPLAVFGSYPAVFVGGAVSLGLLPVPGRQGGWKSRLLWAAFNAALLGCFLVNFLVVGKGQLRTPTFGTTTEVGMQVYWSDGFPPSAPLPLVKWLVLVHTGQMTAYPLGAQDGGSTLTTLLCLVGAWQFWRTGRRRLLVLCAAPFPLWFVAAVLHRYPYGASCRLCQHVAPIVCLTAGMGAAVLLERVPSSALRRRWIVGVCTVLVLVALGGTLRDVLKPYRDAEARWTGQVMRQFRAEAGPTAPIVVLNNPNEVDALFLWHLELYGDRVSWDGRIDWEKAKASGEILCVRYWQHSLTAPGQLVPASSREAASVPLVLKAQLEQQKQPWRLQKAVTDTCVPSSWQDPVKHFDQFHWWRVKGGGYRPPPFTLHPPPAEASAPPR